MNNCFNLTSSGFIKVITQGVEQDVYNNEY